MSTDHPVLGEIRLFAYSQLPNHWLPCEGQELSIAENQALYSVLGTTYGGDGKRTFRLPDLRGRVVVGADADHPLGSQGGSENHQLTSAEAGQHSHELFGSADLGSTSSPLGAVPGSFSGQFYASNPPPGARDAMAASLSDSHTAAPHENRQPYQVVQYAIAVQATYPDFWESRP